MSKVIQTSVKVPATSSSSSGEAYRATKLVNIPDGYMVLIKNKKLVHDDLSWNRDYQKWEVFKDIEKDDGDIWYANECWCVLRRMSLPKS